MPVVTPGGLGPPQLGPLICQVRRELARAGDLVNEVGWMMRSCPPYLRPLVDDGLRARTGARLGDRERSVDQLLESVRFLDHARLDRDQGSFLRCAEELLADSAGAMSTLKAIRNGLRALPEEASSLSPEGRKGEAEKLSLRQSEALGDLLSSMEMLCRLPARGRELIS